MRMDKGWFDRLVERIRADERSMSALSQDAKFGRNYIQQMIKDRKEPGADHLARLLDQLGPRAALYVFTGLDLEEDDRKFLAALSGMDAEMKRDALRLFQRIGSGEGHQAPQPSGDG